MFLNPNSAPASQVRVTFRYRATPRKLNRTKSELFLSPNRRSRYAKLRAPSVPESSEMSLSPHRRGT